MRHSHEVARVRPRIQRSTAEFPGPPATVAALPCPGVSPVNDQTSRRVPPAAVAIAIGLLVLASACGSSDPGDGTPGEGAATVDDGPRVADRRFDGTFDIVELTIGGSTLAPAGNPTLEIETRFGGLTVADACNRWFGSFTLAEDGAASFTVTGGTELDCGELATDEETVLAALAAVETWTAVDGGFRFDGPAASLMVRGPTRS